MFYGSKVKLIYTILYTIGFIALSPAFVYKMWKRGKYRENFFQRFGRYVPEMFRRLADKQEQRCWIQAVSVGEVNLAFTFIAALRKQFPQLRIILTTTTSTGYALAKQRLPKEIELLYFPQDFPFAVRRAYNLIQPDFIVLMESELWPNHIWEAARRNVPVFLVNARMSPRSAARHKKYRWPFCHIWPCLQLVCVQSQPDFENYLAAGVARERLHLTGNIKYDASLPQAGQHPFDPAQVLRDLGVAANRSVLVGGSTWPGEEEILFDILKKIPELFLVLVPRHVERTPEIVELAKRKNIKLALRKTDTPTPNPDCLLVNTTGELKWFYEPATIIFVGKSLAGNFGGQNIVEAAASGHPVLFGARMDNFKEISRQFVEAGACVQVADAADLSRAVEELLRNAPRRDKIAVAAREVIASNAGATQRTVELIASALSGKK
jgi:3-deoxy-D-manno-octulosonic-acid transferase